MAITRLSGGITPGDGADPRTFPAIFNSLADDIDSLSIGTAVATDGQVLTYSTAVSGYVPEDSSGLPSNAYAFVETVYFTSNGTFSKGSYPWLRAIRVSMVGGGGGGGGTDIATVGRTGAGRSGSGAVYAEAFITDIASLTSSVTVTVGAQGTGGAAPTGGGTSGNGTDGGESSFGSGESFEVSAAGGLGGARGSDFTDNRYFDGIDGATTGVGDLTIPGGASGLTFRFPEFNLPGAISGSGGGSVLGTGATLARADGNANVAGKNGLGYGSGGSGAANSAETTQQAGEEGGNGSAGIVILELFA